MPNILNLTLPLKQDAASQAQLGALAKQFTDKLWPQVSKVLKDSRMVHYARFTVIDNRWLQVLTEYDTDFLTYSNFFADNLHQFFVQVFALVEGSPDVTNSDVAQRRQQVFSFIKKYDLPCLGGVHFEAYPDLTVKEIQQKFGIS